MTFRKIPGKLHGRTKNLHNRSVFSYLFRKRREVTKFILLHPGLDNEQRGGVKEAGRSASDEVQRIFAIDLAMVFENRLRLFKFQVNLVRILKPHGSYLCWLPVSVLLNFRTLMLLLTQGGNIIRCRCLSTLCNLYIRDHGIVHIFHHRICSHTHQTSSRHRVWHRHLSYSR
ncbi:hypothetical protein BANRA_05867 [Escherichia coli]|nr:hypothetical protein BANRA_05867 [Escherichia coli]